MAEERKSIEVVAAVIIEQQRVFATQRGYGEWQGWWEFPGGKLESGESPEAALHREIQEELATHVEVGEDCATVSMISNFTHDVLLSVSSGGRKSVTFGAQSLTMVEPL